MTGLRDRRRLETRARIVEATLTLMAERDPASIEMPAVARAADVSVRTLYRYFPNKTELLVAAGAWFDTEAWTAEAGLERVDETNIAAYQRARFADFDRNRAGVLAQIASPAGRDVRRSRVEEHRRLVAEALDRLDLPLGGPDRGLLVDALVAIGSSLMFVELVDTLGHRADDAADLTAWMLQAVVAQAAATGSVRPSEPTEVPS